MRRKSYILVLLLVVATALYILKIGKEVPSEEAHQKAGSQRSVDNLENLRKYRERFELNEYHLSKALESVNQLKQVLDTLHEPLLGDAASELKILHHRSLVHVEEIINSISNYNEYPNFSEQKHLDSALKKLQKLDYEIQGDSLKYDDIYKTFDYTLKTMAKAALNISKAALKTDQRELAVLTLRQAQMHLKHAMLLDYFSVTPDPEHKMLESTVFEELDSLLQNKSVSVSELERMQIKISLQLDQLIEERKALQ